MSFQEKFIWGAATASYQIEGAAYEDGKGLSVWDAFCKQPGNVFEGHTGDVACDHYHRYIEDVQIMKKMGIKHYRFSISWPRILPDGTGKINEKGIEFYSNLIDELLKNGITPHATLFHWDYPYPLFCKGGWLNPDSPEWFAKYTYAVVSALGDRLKNYFTLNEPQCFIGLSLQKTEHAPGVAFSTKDGLQMAHHVMLAHGKAVQVIRSIVKDSCIGYAPCGTYYYPESDNPKDIEAARLATFKVLPENWYLNVAWWSDPILLGHYPQSGVEAFKDIMPNIKEGDMETICQPLDFYGQNIYHASPVRFDEKNGYKSVHGIPGHSKTAIGWPVTPEALYWVPNFLDERYKMPLIITENGLSCHDTVSLDGKVHDPNRIDFLNRYLLSLRKASEGGVDIRGYFQWSLMDNFEWAKGYDDRFGLVYVDYTTQQRILKDSAYWYKEVMESNGDIL